MTTEAAFPPIIKLETDDTTAFLRAARSGNLEKVIEYLDTDLDINTANSNGLNALHLASKDGHVEIVTELLKRGAKVDAATKKGNTALHIASLAGQAEIVNILIQYGAAVNIQSQNGFTPLYMAAQENHDQVVKLLLSNGANQSLATEDGFTPLAVAMQQGHEKVVSVLLENDSKGKVRLPALHIAAKKDDCKAADLLLQNDHKPDVTSKSGFTPLHIAAHYGNEEIARLLIKRGADVNYLAKHNISPLHVAAKWGKNNMVKILLENSAMIDAKTRDGLTPLHCAARSGHEEVVSTLLEHEAPISARTKNGLAPLHMASQGDHVDAARVLLYHRAPVDEVTIDYLTSLHVAAHCGHVRVAKLLLDRKADPNARALNGFTPLHIACKKNRIKVVELLLKHGASIESTTESGLTPLHVASFMGCMNIVIFLLQHEANPDVPTVRGETPLHLAARANQTDIIRILLRNGAKVDARAREEQTPLHIASRLGNVDIVMLLLQHGAAVDTTTKDMYTALHIAAKEGQEEVAAILVENHASVKAATKNGFTPLHIAAKYGNMNVAKILLQKDSKLDAQGKNDITPLQLACHYDHSNVANMILEKGASPHLASQNGHTPLHIAARKNQMDIASTLLEHGADPNVQSKAGFTPLQLSAQKGHYDMTNLLIEHGADPNHKAKNGLTALHLCAQEDFIRVASILVKNGANVESETETGYRPIHVAAHFGNLSMIRFLLKHNAQIDVRTNHNYTPLHQAAQQGHAHIVSALLEGNASHNARTTDGLTALNVAQKLGYISVMEVLKGLSYDTLTPDNRTWEEKYKVIAPESLQETSFMSDSDDEGGSDGLINEQPYRYLTADLMKSLRDDSLPIDVTRDDPIHRQVSKEEKQEFVQSNNYCLAENFDTNDSASLARLHFRSFLVSFLVDARGGAMKGCRHSGIRIIVPPRRATMPIRVTCRLIKPSKVANPPSLMEGEALATRIVEMGPVGASFLGPVLIDVPHFASVQGKEREIIILRSENGETWKEHDNSPDNDDTLFNTPHDTQMSASHSGRIMRILTTEFPQYFAIVTRIKQEVHVIGADGGILISSVANHVQAVFPPGALTKKIKVGLQAHVIPAELTAKLLGNCVAVSPVITIEPRRRKFHKPITLTIPVPQAANKGMINHYGGETPTLRLLCSIAGGTSEAQWEDVTGSTPLTFMNDRVSFTTTVSARFWLMDCRNISEVPKMATELYKESLFVPFITNFVIYTKRLDVLEATLRILCMTDGKEGIHTLERQEEFLEIVKSRDVEALDGKDLYIEFSGNLVPVTKSGVQLKFTFKAFRQNRLSFHVKVRDPLLDPVARMMFMRDPKVAKGEPSQQPICILNIVLPDHTAASESEKKIKEYEDSNLKGRKEDRLRSSYAKDEDEKGDKPKPSSPSESKFITDILQKEQTDAATIHESFAQKAACPLESVDASYPSNVSVQDELSPEVEKQTYTEKRRFWEDITRKRENYQRSESELSRTSQLTVNESDSECCIQNIVSEEETAEAAPGRSETMEDMNIPDISECSVAEKAHYFEEQIQKELSTSRPTSKLITQESLKDKDLVTKIPSKIASELSTEKPEKVEREEEDPKGDKQDWNFAESMKKEKISIVGDEKLQIEKMSTDSGEKMIAKVSTFGDEKMSSASNDKLQKEKSSTISSEILQKERIGDIIDEKMAIGSEEKLQKEMISTLSVEKLQKEMTSTLDSDKLQKELFSALSDEKLQKEKMATVSDEKLPKEAFEHRESLETTKSEITTTTKKTTGSRTEYKTEISKEILVETTTAVQKEVKTEIAAIQPKSEVTVEKPDEKHDVTEPSIAMKESVLDETKKKPEKTKIPSKIPELKKPTPPEFDSHRKICSEFLHHETKFSHAELESTDAFKSQVGEKDLIETAKIVAEAEKREDSIDKEKPAKTLEIATAAATSSPPEEATKPLKEDSPPSMIPRKISPKEAKKVPLDEAKDAQTAPVEPLVGLTADKSQAEREVTPVDKESTSPSEKVALKMQEEAKMMKKESRIPISAAKAEKEKTLKAKEEITSKSPVSPAEKSLTKLERRSSDEESTSSKDSKPPSPKDDVTSPKKEFESRIPKRSAVPRPTQDKREAEKTTETVTETTTTEKLSSQHYQKVTSEVKTKTLSKSVVGQAKDAELKIEETEKDSSVVTSKIDHRASTEITEVSTSDPTKTSEKIVKHEATEHKQKEKLSESQLTKATPHELLEEKQSESVKSELSAAEEICMIMKDGKEAVDARASQLKKLEKGTLKMQSLTDELGTFAKTSEVSSIKERETSAALKIEREEPINLEDEMKNAAVSERKFEETLVTEEKRVIPSELKSEEVKVELEKADFSVYDAAKQQEHQEQMEEQEEQEHQEQMESRDRHVAETMRGVLTDFFTSGQTEKSASLEGFKHHDTSDSDSKESSENVLDMDTTESEVFHDQIADDMTKIFESMEKRSRRQSQAMDETTEMLAERKKCLVLAPEEKLEITSNRGSISVSEDFTKDEESTPQDKEGNLLSSSEHHKLIDRDITVSPSSISDQIDLEVSMESEKSVNVEQAKRPLEKRSLDDVKPISQETAEPEFDYQSRQDSIDVPSLEIDEPRSFGQQEFVDNSSSSFERYSKEPEFSSIHESPAIESLDKICLDRDITVSPSTVSEDTNVDFSLVQDQAERKMDGREKLANLVVGSLEGEEIESPSVISPRLRLKELEIKPVNWMIGDEKIEVSEPLQPFQAFDKELEEYQTTIMRQQSETLSRDGSADFEQESGTRSSEDVSAIDSVKETFVEDARTTITTRTSKFTVVPVNEPDFESELVENRLDVSCQELVDTLQREYEAKTPTDDREFEGTRYTFETDVTTGLPRKPEKAKKSTDFSVHTEPLLDASGAVDIGLGKTGDLSIDVPTLTVHDKVVEGEDKTIDKEIHDFVKTVKTEEVILKHSQLEDKTREKPSGILSEGKLPAGEGVVKIALEITEAECETIEDPSMMGTGDEFVVEDIVEETPKIFTVADTDKHEDSSVIVPEKIASETEIVEKATKIPDEKQIEKFVHSVIASGEEIVAEALAKKPTEIPSKEKTDKIEDSTTIATGDKIAAEVIAKDVTAILSQEKTDKVEISSTIATGDKIVTEVVTKDVTEIPSQEKTDKVEISSTSATGDKIVVELVTKVVTEIPSQEKIDKVEISSTIATGDKIVAEVVTKDVTEIPSQEKTDKVDISSTIATGDKIVAEVVAKDVTEIPRQEKTDKVEISSTVATGDKIVAEVVAKDVTEIPRQEKTDKVEISSTVATGDKIVAEVVTKDVTEIPSQEKTDKVEISSTVATGDKIVAEIVAKDVREIPSQEKTDKVEISSTIATGDKIVAEVVGKDVTEIPSQEKTDKVEISSTIATGDKIVAEVVTKDATEIPSQEKTDKVEHSSTISTEDKIVAEVIAKDDTKIPSQEKPDEIEHSSAITTEDKIVAEVIAKDVTKIPSQEKPDEIEHPSTIATGDKIVAEVVAKDVTEIPSEIKSEKSKDSSAFIPQKIATEAEPAKDVSRLSEALSRESESKVPAQEPKPLQESAKAATRLDEAKTDVRLKGLKQSSPSKSTKSSHDEQKKQASDSEHREKSGDASAFKLKKEDLPSVDLSARYAITVLDQVVKKEIAEVQESLEAAKQDLIEELSENSETVFQIKDSPSEFQFKLEPETIPNDLPFLYKAPSIEQEVAQPSAEGSPIAKPRKHADAKDDAKVPPEVSTKVSSTIGAGGDAKKPEEIPARPEPSEPIAKTVQIETVESEIKSKITVQREMSGDTSTEERSSHPAPVAASRSSSDMDTKDEGVSLLTPQPAPRRRQKPARASRKVTSESDAGSSSGDSSNYQSCDYDIGSGSRPSSSDIEALHSTLPSGTVSEYESALMSIEHSSVSRPTSQDYQSAVSTLSSRESMKSLNSLSSGHLGSIDSTGELSETLVASEADDDEDDDEDGVSKDHMDENLEGILEDDRRAAAKGSDSSGSEIPMEDAFDKTDDDLPCRMKRSSEMIFQQIMDEAAAEAATEEEEAGIDEDTAGPEEETRFDECTTEQLPSDTVAEDEEAFRTDSIFMSTDLTSEAYDKSLSSMESKTDVPEGQIEGDVQNDLPLLDTHLEAEDEEEAEIEADLSEGKPAIESSADETAALQTSVGTLLHQASTTSSTSGAMSFETVIEKDQKIDRHSPDSDSFELVDKPDIIDDFVVIEEVGREAEEFDSEGKSISIGAISYTSIKKYDRDLENLITENKEEQVSTSQVVARNNELFEFESEESPPQASNDDQYSQSLSDDENFEGSKKWMEMQFQNDPRGYDLEYDRGRLEDIKEEEITDFEAGSSRFGSLGSHKGSIGSVGSMRGSFTDYDVLAGKKCFSKPAEHDNVSLSSLQEFEHLESAVALENSKKLQCGSQDSVNNGSLPRRYMASRSGHGDDVSLSSLKDFEGLEKACREAHLIELRAREEEDLLDHESPENRYKLENLPRPKPAEPASAAGSFNPSTSGSDDYEKRIMEIDEIIRIAQANVEKFDRQDDTTEDISQIEITAEAEKVEAVAGAAVVAEAVAATTAESEDVQQALRDTNVMETSTDSLELEENADKKYNPLCRSSDSLEMKTTIDFPSLSSDSLNNVRDPREATVDTSADMFNSGRRISSDSLEMPLVEQQDPDSHDKSSGSHGSYHVKGSFDDSVEQTSTDTKITNNGKTRSPSTSDT